MPYGAVATAFLVVFVIRHVRSTYASNRSKCLVGGLAAFTILAPYLWPRSFPLVGSYVGMLSFPLQVVIAVYLTFHEAIWRPDDNHAEASRTCQQTIPPVNHPGGKDLPATDHL